MKTIALAATILMLTVQAADAAAVLATSFVVRGADRLDCIVTNISDKEVDIVTELIDAGGIVVDDVEETLQAGSSITAGSTTTTSVFCRITVKGKKTAIRALLCRRTGAAAECLHTSEAR
jgi:hypothetical protein